MYVDLIFNKIYKKDLRYFNIDNRKIYLGNRKIIFIEMQIWIIFIFEIEIKIS